MYTSKIKSEIDQSQQQQLLKIPAWFKTAIKYLYN